MLRKLWKLILLFNGVSYEEQDRRSAEPERERERQTKVIHWEPPPGSERETTESARDDRPSA